MNRETNTIVASLLLVSFPRASTAQDAAALYNRSKSAIVTVTTESGTGTGFIVGDGTLAFTCYHVVQGSTSIAVEGVKRASATIVYSDPVRDLSILRLDKRFGSSLSLSKSTPEPGTRVYVIGSALGIFDKTITEGLVSGIRHQGDRSILQISASITHGNSGSPVLSLDAKVVGMAQSYYSGTSVNLAVSSYDLRNALELAGASVPPNVKARYIPDSDATQPRSRYLGYLVKATKATQIHSKPLWNSHLIQDLAVGQRIMCTGGLGGTWIKVPLRNGQLGYVPRTSIARLPIKAFSAKDNSPASEFALLMTFGTPYTQGGADSIKGFGNPELLQIAYLSEGTQLPHDLDAQCKIGTPIYKLEYLLPGDRLYFRSPGVAYIQLGGIFVGGDSFVMADPKEGKVCSHSLLDPKWRQLLVAARG